MGTGRCELILASVAAALLEAVWQLLLQREREHVAKLILGAQTFSGSFVQGGRLHTMCTAVFSQSLFTWLFSTFAGCLYKFAGCLVVGFLSPVFTWSIRPGGFRLC